MTLNRASAATMVRSESGPSLVELYVNEDISPLQLNPVTRVKMAPGKAQEGVILMENIVKSFSWMENRLGVGVVPTAWPWLPGTSVHRARAAGRAEPCGAVCGAVPSKSRPQHSQPSGDILGFIRSSKIPPRSPVFPGARR